MGDYVAPAHDDMSARRNDLVNIVGELWEVGEEALQGLDDYEGISKGYYSKISIQVKLFDNNISSSTSGSHNSNNNNSAIDSSDVRYSEHQASSALSQDPHISADVYVLNNSTPDLQSREFIQSYTLQIHEEVYKPIQHIQVKQFNYFKTPSTWGKTIDIIEESKVKPNS